MRTRFVLSLLAVLFAAAAPAAAQDIQEHLEVNASVLPNGSLVFDVREQRTALSAAGARNMSLALLKSWTGEKVSSVEAFTQKEDGKSIPVPASDIASQQGIVGPGVSEPEAQIVQIHFRDVDVGDSTIWITRSIEQPAFAGHFSYLMAPPAPGIPSTVKVTLRSPPDLQLYHNHLGLTYEERREGEVLIRTWAGDRSIQPIPATQRGATDVALSIPHLSFSSFASYEDIGRAYMSAAAPKAEPSAALQKLADDITAGKTGVLAQTEAIFRWVAGNIRYTAIHFGSGRVVPNDLETVLSRGFGDCKDKAALMVALLSAKGIEAQHALIQSGPSYELPKTAVIEAFDHVVVYVPQLGQYADPSTSESLLGALPPVLKGKPVVRAWWDGKASAAMDRTPVGTAEENTAHINGTLKMSREGLVSGESSVEATGEFAFQLRQFTNAAHHRGNDWASQMVIGRTGAPGKLRFEFPSARDEPYRVKTTWRTDTPFVVPRHSWKPQKAIAPLMAVPMELVSSLEQTDDRRRNVACRPGRMVQETATELPAEMLLESVPPAAEATAPYFSYKRSWKLDERVLLDRIEIAVTVDTRSCTPEIVDAISESIMRKLDDLAPRLVLVEEDAAAADDPVSSTSE